MSSQPSTQTMTADEFLALPESNTRIELIAGVVVVPPSPDYTHQAIQREVMRVLLTTSAGEVLNAPMDVWLDDESVVQPDVLWLAPDTACTIDRIVRGAPDLVVEILLPGTAKHDWQDKFALYEKHGSREYWIIDPRNHTLDQFVRQGDRFVHRGTFTVTDTLHSDLLNMDIPLKQLFPTETE